jgi:gephyrin
MNDGLVHQMLACAAAAAAVRQPCFVGAVSMGDRDLLKPLLERKGQVHFGRVLMKPGKPLTFATLEIDGSSRKLLVFGLPGDDMR